MYHVRKALINMPSRMELEKYYEWLDKEEGIGERVLILILSTLTPVILIYPLCSLIRLNNW